jgi:hypothetical protein
MTRSPRASSPAGDTLAAMAGTLGQRCAVAAILGAFAFACPATASAQFFSFPTTKAPPGELSGTDVLFITMAATGAAVPMVYAGVLATDVDRPPKSNGAYVGFTIGGGVLGVLTSVYLPWVEYGAPAFAATFLDGVFLSMAGVGVGGLARPADLTVPWLGGSIGLGTAAVYRGILSFAGQADNRGAAAGQLTVGLLGAVGCSLNAIFQGGSERWVAVGCGGVSLLAAIHGGVMLGRPDRLAHPHARKRGGFQALPVPWFQAHGGGAALAGQF